MSSQAGFGRRTALAVALWCGVGGAGLMAAMASHADPAAAQVLVNGIAFEGNSTYSSQDLSGLVAAEIGRPMTLLEIQKMAAEVERFYHDAGYPLVKVVVPAQTFADGRPVRMVVLEGQLGQVTVKGNRRFDNERVAAALRAAGVEAGEPLKLSEVERALTRVNRLSGITASATLRPGDRQGYTDLQVDIEEAPRVSGAVEINNFGSEDTGEYRVIPSIKLENLSGRGDGLNLLGMKSIGDGDAYFGYLDYTTPLNARGTSLQVYGSSGNVNIGREFRVLEIEGDSTSAGIGLMQDQVLSARNVLTYSLWLEGTDLEQTMLGTTVAEDQVRKVRLGVGLDHSDLFGRTLASVDVHQGLGENLGGMDNDSVESSRSFAGADNRFTKITVDLTRIQRLTSRTVLIPRLYGQYAFDPLVSSEQWAIGGVNSVKGHLPSAYSGDSGFTASLEGRYDLLAGNDRYQLIGQLSHGRLYIKRPFVDQDDEQDISGVSVGVQARPVDSLEMRLDWGLPVGTETGDNSYIYAQARYRF
ncbi:hemin-binding protein [Alcanivorax sp. N3-2A]|nr:hemin-binding protein [Alcanivorax sp. N3-2A]|tara:strand:+ start:5327 stop:6913 length:1587 start_codon:yes stop_codon:yes gene_type:complete